MKLFKYLILPISIICCYNNVGNTMNNKIPCNHFYGDVVSLFHHDSPLNNKQKEFIKHFINDINNSFTPNYDSIYVMIANEESALPPGTKLLFYNAFEEPFNSIVLNFLKRLKQCYKENIINKNGYILLLKCLLYCNTDSIYLKLADNISEIKDKNFNKDKPLCSLFTNVFNPSLKDIEDDEYCYKHGWLLNKNKLQNFYEFYKSVMKQIINDLLTVIVLDNNQPCTKELLEETIFEPIILGMLRSYYKNGRDIKQSYLKIKENISIIDQEFRIRELYKRIKLNNVTQGLYRLLYKDEKTGKETARVKSKYITKQIDSYVPQDKLPYEVKCKNKENK